MLFERRGQRKHSEEGILEQEPKNVVRKKAIRIYEGKAFLRYRVANTQSLP